MFSSFCPSSGAERLHFHEVIISPTVESVQLSNRVGRLDECHTDFVGLVADTLRDRTRCGASWDESLGFATLR